MQSIKSVRDKHPSMSKLMISDREMDVLEHPFTV